MSQRREIIKHYVYLTDCINIRISLYLKHTTNNRKHMTNVIVKVFNEYLQENHCDFAC